MKNKYYLELIHKLREWSSVNGLEPITNLLKNFRNVENDKSLMKGCLFLHANDFKNDKIYQYECKMKTFFSQQDLKWGIIFITGGEWNQVEKIFIDKKDEIFENASNKNECHLLRYPIPTTVGKKELEARLSRYLENDDPLNFDLLYEDENIRDFVLAFRLLLDCACILISPDTPCFKNLPPEIIKRAKETRDEYFWKSYWEPVTEFIQRSKTKMINMEALCLDYEIEKCLQECLSYIRDRLNTDDGMPDPDEQCIKNYLSTRYPA